ncbi:MAG TPA: M4 family metallopeptidase, partial [Lysobacter sp.]|nr:M4 family metallopeptidase [Lysobacter sp.]
MNNDPNIFCPNASWNGVSTNYCNGVTGDDTVAHEWGHAYTEYTANLIYAWQPGALNESFSDVWGEVVDFLNGRGTDAPLTARTAGSCSVYGAGPNTDNSYRWLSGEDDPAFGGAIRDMWTPTCYGDPGKVSDGQYWCSTEDNGGVHINSGVPNHAFALLVDGGSYNSQAIGALGLLKSTHLFWNTLQLLVPPSDFAQMADALEASCAGLLGVDLPQLSTSQPVTGLSGTAISAGDCAQVGKAIAAVQLRSEPIQCGFGPLLDTSPPPRCEGLGALVNFAATDWESGLEGWTASRYAVSNEATFGTPDWAVVGALPDERTGSAAFVADLIAGDCQLDDETGALALDSPTIEIPQSAEVPRLSLNHWVATEAGWDGGNLKISVNGGPFTLVPEAAIEVSPYNATLNSAGMGNSNPLAGQPAFTGSDGGGFDGSWGQSQVNLYGLAAPGDSVRLRLDFGVDGCNGVTGWYVDEVEFYRCAAELPPSPCGNSLPDAPEQCDDGNQEDGDGCSASCEVESGWECTAAVAATPVPDHSFELGGAWTEFSTHFGSPVCRADFCGTGGGSGASDGDYWVWFGGIVDQVTVEQGSMAQTLTIPPGATVLTFDLELPACDTAADYMDVRIDDQVVYSVNGGDAACDLLGYQTREVDISAFA